MEISVIASGSNGNSCLVEEKDSSVLIDAGKSGKEIEKRLSKMGKSLENINAILLTHSHIDHVRGASVIARRYNLPVYMLHETYEDVGMQFCGVDVKKFNSNSKFCISGLEIKPVATSHDVPSCGFVVGDFGIFTDTGRITKEMKCALPKLRGVLLESNHDIDMLINGPYPPYLKQRIISDRGHLNNICASQIIEELGSSLSFALLGHLSGTNNTPKVASSTFEAIVKKKVDYKVCSREKGTGVWEL
jgi:phosphoribosyl 1,2-cyclic phosphodiesterase